MRNFLIFLSLIALVGCPKKREETFVQGHGRELLAISDFDGKEFSVETLALVSDYKENPKISNAENLKLTDKNDAATMGVVNVKSDAELLNDVPFVGLPNQKSGYKVKYSINNGFLIVLKVAERKLIHPSELPGAIEIDKNTVAVPLVGYPIKGFYNTENVEVNRQKSDRIVEAGAKSKDSAKFFKLDLSGRVLYKFQEKMDVFSKEYFNGTDGKSEWYFAQTVVGVAADGPVSQGWILAQEDRDLNTLSKIRFVLDRDEIKAINTNVDPRINTKDPVNQFPLVTIPAEWKDYRPTPSGTNSIAMTEEENKLSDWEKRKYIKLNFEKASTLTIADSKFKFVDLVIGNDYFSFTLFDPAYNIRVKQAFLRAGQRDFTPKRHFDEDFEKFGYFSTQRQEFNVGEKYRREDFGKNIYLNRFNPKKSVIEFYMTEGSDENYLPLAQKAAEEWTKAFQTAGTGIQVTVHPTKKVQLGDIRYNQINLINPKIPTGLFGLGPSVTDPATGEIISATSNLDARSYYDYIVDFVRDYLLQKAEILHGISVITGIPGIDNSVATKNSKSFFELGVGERPLLRKFPDTLPNGEYVLREIEYGVRDSKKDHKKINTHGKTCNFGVTAKNIINDIDQLCPELIAVAARIKDGGKHERESELVGACAEKLVPGKIFGTLLHELGHNFGLRHNFAGSADPNNFYSKEDTSTNDQIQTSTVMDYPSFSEDRMSRLGLYDIAAIKFGYADSIELEDGSSIKLQTDKPIVDNLKDSTVNKSLVKAKSFKFCTDEDTFIGTDPMCARWDHGTNPHEKVLHIINEYNHSIARLNFRLMRKSGHYTQSLTRNRLVRYWIPMKKIYDEWRYRLNDQLGLGNEYLESIDSKKIQEQVGKQRALCDRQRDPISDHCLFVDYQKAADAIFEFAIRIATLPPRYCIGERNGKIASVEFGDVRRIIMAQTKEVPKNCSDKRVQTFIHENYAFSPTEESGYELEDVRLDSKVRMSKTLTDWWGNPLPEAPDISGLMPEKIIAIEVLAARASLSMSSDEKSFLPNFLDEQKYRDRILSYIADRLTKGIVSSDLVKGGLAKKYSDQHIEKFKYEKQYISDMVQSIMYGLEVPGKSQASRERKKKFLVRYTSQMDILNRAKYKVLGLDGTNYYATMSDDATEGKKLLKMLETLPQRLAAASPLDENTFKKLIELADTHLSEDDKSIDPAKFIEFVYLVIEDEFPDSPTAGRTQDQRNIDKYRAHWKRVLQKEAAIVRFMAAKINEGGKEALTYIAPLMTWARDIESFANPNNTKTFYKDAPDYLMGVSNLIYSEGYTLNRKTLKERIEAYKIIAAQEIKQSNNDDIFNYDEISTQMDMIMNVLRSMTEY